MIYGLKIRQRIDFTIYFRGYKILHNTMGTMGLILPPLTIFKFYISVFSSRLKLNVKIAAMSFQDIDLFSNP